MTTTTAVSGGAALEAGRALDAEVATRVMRWALADRTAMGWGDGPPVWLTGEDSDDEGLGPTFQDFSPSTNMGDAWLVVEHFKSMSHHFDIRVGFDWDGLAVGWIAVAANGPRATADTAALAICRAAVLTMRKAHGDAPPEPATGNQP